MESAKLEETQCHTHMVTTDDVHRKPADVDIALAWATELDSAAEPSEDVKRRVLRKIDFILLPLISMTSTLSFMDKVSNNYANNFGLSKALHMTGDQFSWSASIFFLAFLVWQPAVSYMTQHLPLGKLISVNCFCWGLILLGQGFVKTYAGFVTLRFFQGIFEASVLPSFLMMCSIWWTREEQSLRSAFWFNSMSAVLSGIFAYAIGKLHVRPGLVLYQYIYIIYGSFSAGWGLLLYFVIPDTPLNAWFLNHEEKLAAVARIKVNQTGMINRTFKKKQAWEAVLDPKTWYYGVFAFISNAVNGGLNAYSTTIIAGFGYSPLQTTLLGVPWGVIAVCGNIVIGLAISYTSGKRLILMAGIILIPLVGEIMQFVIPPTHKGAALAGYYLTGAYNAPYVMMLGLISGNTAGTTKKVVTGGILWVFYCGGNFAGPFFFRASEKPRYVMGIGMILGSFVLQFVMSIGFRVYLVHLNKLKDRAQSEADLQEDNHMAQHAFADLTDKENLNFRYTY